MQRHLTEERVTIRSYRYFLPVRLSFLITVTVVFLFCSMEAEAARRRRSTKDVRVRTVNVEVKNVFDPEIPEERYWPYRVANVLHIRTRAAVIRRQLLVRPGEYANQRLFEESERNLRSLSFVKDAKIIETPAPNGEVDLLVRTQDTWTTQPQINFGSEGGQSTFEVGMLEENLFGYGKSLSYFFNNDADGSGHDLQYKDPQLFNSRYILDTLVKDTPFGNEQHVTVTRPFYSFETRFAGGLQMDRIDSIERVFSGGNETNRFKLQQLNSQAFMGMRVNNDPTRVHRTSLRYRYTENIYEAEARTLPDTLPARRAISAPIFGWSYQEMDFIKETFIDRAERIEDINLGHEVVAGVGYSAPFLGATESAIPYTLAHDFGFGGDGPWFGLTSYGTTGRYNTYRAGQSGGRPINTLYYGNLNFYRHVLPEFPLTAALHMESAYVQNPDVENPLELGGDTGLRGYKVRAFTGDKTVLGNIETRFFYPYEILRLAYLGGAVFMDAGQAQPRGRGFNRKDVRANVGAGLRVALTRSTEGTIFRLDVAYALGHLQPGEDRVIISITSGQGFNRTNNTSGRYAPIITR